MYLECGTSDLNICNIENSMIVALNTNLGIDIIL